MIFKLYRRCTIAVAVIFALVLCLSGVSSSFAHTLVDNTNARVEAVTELTPHTVQGVKARIDAVLASNFPGGHSNPWVWGGISATDPFYGDCHSGETSTTHITAVRVGWIKLNSSGFTPARKMLAYVTNNGSIVVNIGAIHN